MYLSAYDWRRYGRGRVFQFYATDGEIHSVLNSVLNEIDFPYCYIGRIRVATGKESSFRLVVSGEYIDIVEKTYGNDVYLYCAKLSGKLEEGDINPNLLTELCAVNGLISLQGIYRRSNGYYMPAIFSLVDKVQNNAGEVIQFAGYYDLYLKIIQLMKQRLPYTTFIANGVESKSIFASEMIKAQFDSGMKLSYPIHRKC